MDELVLKLLMAAPELPAELLKKMQLEIFTLEEKLYIPPPNLLNTGMASTAVLLLPLAFPPITEKPSNTVVLPSLIESTTW